MRGQLLCYYQVSGLGLELIPNFDELFLKIDDILLSLLTLHLD